MNANSMIMTESLTDRTAAVRRKHIMEAAARTFAAAGYQRTTIRDVAQSAGVADGTIYNSFANKADLLLSLLDPLEERLPGSTVSAASLPPALSDIEGLLRDRWSVFTPEVLDLLRVILSEALVDKSVGAALLARVLGPAIEPLELALTSGSAPDPAMAARTAVATFLGLAILRMLGEPVLESEAETVPGRLATLLTTGLDRREVA